MLLCHFKFSFKKDKLNFRFIGTLTVLSLPWGPFMALSLALGPFMDLSLLYGPTQPDQGLKIYLGGAAHRYNQQPSVLSACSAT